jgi:tRNA A58 N-methylase Trm61
VDRVSLLCGSIDHAQLASHHTRSQYPVSQTRWMYGELGIKPLLTVLIESNNRISNNMTLVDLGSGRGRLVLAIAAWISQHTEIEADVIGVEKLHDLVQEAKVLEKELSGEIKDNVRITWIEKDILECEEDWIHANVLIMCCTCFEEDLIQKIARIAQKNLKVGALVITTTHRLVEGIKNQRTMSGFKLLQTIENAETSWVTATMYIYEKIAVPKFQNNLLKNLLN